MNPALPTLLVVAAALSACGQGVGSPRSVSPESTAPMGTPPGLPASGPIEPGTYHVAPSDWSLVGYTVTFPDGWQTQYGNTYIKHSDAAGELSFYFVIVDAIYDDPCRGEGEPVNLGPTVDDFVNALVEQPVVIAGRPVDTALGGLPAKRVDLSVPDDVMAEACRMGEQLQIWYSPPADKYFVLLDGMASVYVLAIEGERQVFLTQYRAATTPADLAEMETILESLEIDA